MIGSILQQRYQIVEQLGSAGAVTTYLATDLQVPGNLQLRCVIHCYRLPEVPEDSYLWHHVTLCAQIFYDLSETIEQIPTVYGYFSEGEAFYLVREFIKGTSLDAELSADQPWSQDQVLMLLRDILEILHGLHSCELLPEAILPAQILRRSLDRKLFLAHFPLLPPQSTSESDLAPLQRNFRAIGLLAIAAVTGTGLDRVSATLSNWRMRAPHLEDRETIEIIERLINPDPEHSYPNPTVPWQEVVALMSRLLEEGQIPTTEADDVTPEPPPSKEEIERYVELFAAQGNLAYELGDCQSALSAYEKAIALDPHCVEAICGRGNVRRYLGDYTGSATDFELAVKLVPQYGIAHIGRALAHLLQHGSYPSAVQDFQQGRALLAQPQTAIDYVMRGTAAAQLGYAQSAMADYSTAIQINPQSAIAYNNRGNLRRNGGDLEGAIADFSAVLTIDPQSAVAYNNRGIVYGDLGRYPEAIADYTQAIALQPNFASAYNNRGNSYSDTEQYPESIADYERAIAIQPNFAIAFSNLGNVYRLSTDPHQAILNYDRAIEIDPDLVIAYYNRGITRRQLGDHQGAIDDYSRAIEGEPKHIYAYYHRANARQYLGDSHGAIADYTKVLRLNNQYLSAYYNRAIARTAIEDFSSAIEDLDRAIQLDPEFIPAYYQRGWVLSRGGQHQLALADYDRAITFDPGHLNAHYQRGVTHRELNDLNSAVRDFDRVIELDPNYAPAYYQRGLTYAQIGDRPGAIADYDRAAKLYLQSGDRRTYQHILQQIDRLTMNNEQLTINN
jgi:tetratricopeptide (TPR) repeat protein